MLLPCACGQRARVVHHMHSEAIHVIVDGLVEETPACSPPSGRWIDVPRYSSGSMQVKILSHR